MRKAKKEFHPEMIESLKPENSQIPCRLYFRPPTVDIDICVSECIFKCSEFMYMNYFSYYCDDESCFDRDLCSSCRDLRHKTRIYVHMMHTLMDIEDREKLYEEAMRRSR